MSTYDLGKPMLDENDRERMLEAWAKELSSWTNRITGFVIDDCDLEHAVEVVGLGSYGHITLADEAATINLVSKMKEIFPDVVIYRNYAHTGGDHIRGIRAVGFKGSPTAKRAMLDWYENEGLHEIPLGEYLAGLKGTSR